ncbi:hypothetical protein BGX26_001796 [Mortierella sp. AD094]|nr:hypothetical protein BGX26_001796 [Mortierella sp. AD094]
MYTKKKSTVPLAATAIAAILASSSSVSADHVCITTPTNTQIYQGCAADLGYRVQFSDMAILKWVQLQILNSDNAVVVDNIDRATREQWGETRSRSLSWQVPADLTPGEYTLRAFGNATYPCNDIKNGRHRRCEFVLQDQETLHLQALGADQECPSSATDDDDAVVDTTQVAEQEPQIISTQETPNGGLDINVDLTTGEQKPSSSSSGGDSSNAYSQGNMDYLRKNLASDNSTNNNDNNNTESESASSGTAGYSTPLQLTPSETSANVTDNIVEMRQQEQTIRKVIQESKNYNSKNETLTLNNGTVVPISEMIKDKVTTTRFLETLDHTNSTLANATMTASTTMNSKQNFTSAAAATQDWKHLNSTQLLDVLHHNSSLIAIAPATHSISGTQLGRNFAQEDDTTATAALSTLVGYLLFVAL